MDGLRAVRPVPALGKRVERGGAAATGGGGEVIPEQSQIVVQKFGGSSVADAARLRKSAEHVLAAHRRGRRPVVVVSAMGDTTDDLIELARTVDPGCGDKREMDQLLATGEQVSIALMAMTLKALGLNAVSLTAGQCCIVTDAMHGRATIRRIDQTRIRSLIESGAVPVVAGFQGVAESGDVTTLGRGGSDTTAVAIAAALGGWCEIYKDVDGVFTADPRLVPEARKRSRVSYEEMLEAASLGSQVIHPRAVELAKKFSVPVRVLHSQLSNPDEGVASDRGTLVVGDEGAMESRVVSSVVLKRNVGRISIRGLENQAGIQASVFSPLAAAQVPVDDIMQEDDGPGTINLTFTMDRSDLAEASAIIDATARKVGAQAVRIDSGLCTVSAVGAGMRTSSGVAAVMFRALADEGVRVENITTSEIRISCVLLEQDGERAVRCVHAAFGLQSDEQERQRAASVVSTTPSGRAPAHQPTRG